MTNGESPAAWLFLRPDAVPDEWRERTQPAVFVALLPEEASRILAGEPARASLDPRDARIARLAASGHTTDAIARALGISPRTVARRLAALRERLGVPTSVDLAVALSANGFAVAGDVSSGVTGAPGAGAETEPQRQRRRKAER